MVEISLKGAHAVSNITLYSFILNNNNKIYVTILYKLISDI